MGSPVASSSDARVVLVGAHGHGQWHLRHLRALADRTGIRLVGVCDTRRLGPELESLAGPVPVEADLGRLLERTHPEVTIVCTPIDTHADLALAAAGRGSHVLLEKPPTPTLAELDRLVDGFRRHGRSCQIGFQSLGSQAVAAVRALISEGAIGTVHGIGAAGHAVRDTSYYARGAWAGRRRLDGHAVVDGVLTNPFAHSIASALRIDGSEGPDDIVDVEVELYRAHDIEADDTSCVRLRTARGTTICSAATLCATRERDPYLVVYGDRGRITWWYKRDEVQVDDGPATQHPRTDLLENLVAHIHDPAVPLLVPPESTAGFMRVVEAVRLASEPRPIAATHQRRRRTGHGDHLRRVVSGVDQAVDRAAAELRLFSELDLAWARR